MTSTFPTTVDVAIVGSGPTGAAYARHPQRAGAGRDDRAVRGRPGAHRSARHAREEHRRPRRAAGGPAALGGRPAAHREQGRGRRTSTRRKRVVRPGTHLLPDGYQEPGEDGIPAIADVDQRRRAWARTGPAPARGPATPSGSRSCPTSTSCSTRPSGCSPSTGTRSTTRRYADVVRDRLGRRVRRRPAGGAPGPADAAGRAPAGRRRAGVERAGHRLRRRHARRTRTSRCSPRRRCAGCWSRTAARSASSSAT